MKARIKEQTKEYISVLAQKQAWTPFILSNSKYLGKGKVYLERVTSFNLDQETFSLHRPVSARALFIIKLFSTDQKHFE